MITLRFMRSTSVKQLGAAFCLAALLRIANPASAAWTAPAEDINVADALRVPSQYATIQAAIDAAPDGGTVLVARGVYREPIVISGKSVALVSEFAESTDPVSIEQTVLDGSLATEEDDEARRDEVVLVRPDAGPHTQLVGFTIRGGDDGVSCYAPVTIRHNRFLRNIDAIDYEGGGGLCEHNHFERNEDDAIDLDEDCSVTIQHNHLVNNLDDGIEIRLHPYTGPQLDVLVRRNVIAGNAEDGIQVIDYPGVSNRCIKIEDNLIARNSMAGIGLMDDAVTVEDYRCASPPEKIEIVGNTLCDNEYGLTAGGNVSASRNMFLRHTRAAIKDGGSLRLSDNLFWGNGEDVLK